MSLLIKGVQVVDGTGKEPYRADVLVQGGLISSIGNLKSRGADRVIEGLGHYLVPGFVDIHSRIDHSLSIFSNPGGKSLLKQGITTVIIGQYGESLAPVAYGSLRAIREWSDPGEINVNWQTVGELLNQLERKSLGVNIATLVGHTNLRRDILDERRGVEVAELKTMGICLAQAMKERAFGLSLDLASVCGSDASGREIKELVKITADYRGVSVLGLRDYGRDQVKAVQEILRQTQSLKGHLVIDNLKPLKGQVQDFKKAVELLREAEGKRSIRFTICPSGLSELHIYSFLPPSLRKGSLEKMVLAVQQVKNRKMIEKALETLDLRNIVVASAPYHHHLVGKKIKAIGDDLGISYVDALMKIMEMSKMRATLFYEDVNLNVLRNALADELALITANSNGVESGGGYLANEIANKAFPEYIKTVLKEGLLSLEDAIKKITLEPARYFGIEGVGVVEEGAPADLVLLDRDHYEVKQVLLGGRIFGEEKLKGRILRHH